MACPTLGVDLRRRAAAGRTRGCGRQVGHVTAHVHQPWCTLPPAGHHTAPEDGVTGAGGVVLTHLVDLGAGVAVLQHDTITPDGGCILEGEPFVAASSHVLEVGAAAADAEAVAWLAVALAGAARVPA